MTKPIAADTPASHTDDPVIKMAHALRTQQAHALRTTPMHLSVGTSPVPGQPLRSADQAC